MTQLDIQQILAEIKQDIENKRAQGMYPAGLEQQLEAEFNSILSLTKQGISDRADEIDRLQSLLKTKISELSGLTDVRSRIPGISIIHRIVRRVIARHTMGLASQTRQIEEINAQLIELLSKQSKAHDDADERLVLNLSNHVLDRLAVVDHLALVVTELESKIQKLEATS